MFLVRSYGTNRADCLREKFGLIVTPKEATMRTRAVRPDSAEKTVRDIRRATRRQYSADEKIRVVFEGLQGRDQHR